MGDASNLLDEGAGQLGIELTDQQRSQLLAYLALLRKWNRAYNLSAIRDERQMVIGHLLDSLALLPQLPESPSSIADIGSGAGLPGVPVAIMLPETQVTLLDSNGKKTRFLTQVKIELGLSNVEVVTQRVEQCDIGNRFDFDVVTSRAFSSLAQFFHAAGQMLKPEGLFYAMKGKYPHQELAELTELAERTEHTELSSAAYDIVAVKELAVPFLDAERHIVVAAIDHNY